MARWAAISTDNLGWRVVVIEGEQVIAFHDTVFEARNLMVSGLVQVQVETVELWVAEDDGLVEALQAAGIAVNRTHVLTGEEARHYFETHPEVG